METDSGDKHYKRWLGWELRAWSIVVCYLGGIGLVIWYFGIAKEQGVSLVPLVGGLLLLFFGWMTEMVADEPRKLRDLEEHYLYKEFYDLREAIVEAARQHPDWSANQCYWHVKKNKWMDRYKQRSN